MSKVEAQRAMREARFAAYRASRAAADTPTTNPPPKAAVRTPASPPAVPDAEAVVPAAGDLTVPAEPESLTPSAAPSGEPELCGHRNIGNKSCRRPAGHAEANHRYK
jgi:hypothetical protein